MFIHIWSDCHIPKETKRQDLWMERNWTMDQWYTNCEKTLDQKTKRYEAGVIGFDWNHYRNVKYLQEPLWQFSPRPRTGPRVRLPKVRQKGHLSIPGASHPCTPSQFISPPQYLLTVTVRPPPHWFCRPVIIFDQTNHDHVIKFPAKFPRKVNNRSQQPMKRYILCKERENRDY